MIATLLTALILSSWLYWLVALWLVFAFFRPVGGGQPSAVAGSEPMACGSSGTTGDEDRAKHPERSEAQSKGAERPSWRDRILRLRAIALRSPRQAAEASSPDRRLSIFRAEHLKDKPPVSILKPVKGLDPQAYQNFVSFCGQDYPEYELLFGVADADDPVIPLIERLKREFPHLSIRLFVVRPTGANRKASLLHHLAEQARYDTLVISDSDMRVTPDYLRRVVAPLSDPAVGLVTCPYLGRDAQDLTAGLEALHMGVTFLPSIVIARQVIGMRFAMGATVALRRSDLMRIGGFGALADYLADDYQLGARISQLGLKVHLSDYVVRCVLGTERLWDQWEREVRWMRCASVSRPWQYPGLLLSFATPLALALFLIAGPGWPATQLLLGSLLLRWVVAWLISGRTGDAESRSWLLWLPLRDVLSALTWIVGGLGRRIAWRGEEFVLTSQGRMAPAPPRRTAQLTAWLRRLH